MGMLTNSCFSLSTQVWCQDFMHVNIGGGGDLDLQTMSFAHPRSSFPKHFSVGQKHLYGSRDTSNYADVEIGASHHTCDKSIQIWKHSKDSRQAWGLCVSSACFVMTMVKQRPRLSCCSHRSNQFHQLTAI